jgi:hypothetical protein
VRSRLTRNEPREGNDAQTENAPASADARGRGWALRTPPPLDAGGAEARIDALAKLKALFDSGVLTDRQFADERERLLGG